MTHIICLVGIMLTILWPNPSIITAQPPELPVSRSSPIDPDYIQAPVFTENQDIPDWKARWELAKILGYVKKYPESLVEYEKLLSEKPDLLEARIEMAQILNWMGEPKKAITIYEAHADKLDERARLDMADIYAAIKQYDRAEEIYQKHLKSAPADYRVRTRLADILSWTGRYKESLAQFRQVLAQVPNDIQVRRKYAYVLIWNDQHEDAIIELRKTLNP